MRQTFFFGLCLVAISLPFSPRLNSISIVLLTLFWIAEGSFREKLNRLNQDKLILLFVIFYVWFAIGMFYTENSSVGEFNLEKKLSLLILPLVIGTSHVYDRSMRDKVLIWFAGSVMLGVLISLGAACVYFWRSGDPGYLVHDRLATILDFQPPYFGMFVAFAVIIIAYYWHRTTDELARWKSVILLLACVLGFCFVILLSARTATLFLLFFGSTLLHTYSRKQHIWAFVAGAILVGLMGVLIASSSYLQDRYLKPVLSDIAITEGGKETGLSIRLIKWKCSVEGIMEHPFLGVGTGDGEEYLVRCYQRVNFWGMYDQYRYNSHNQYLETALTLGLPGLLLLLGSIVIPITRAHRQGDRLFLSFVSLFAFCCLTESVLERQWGIVFYTFFVSLFSFARQLEPGKQS